MEKNYFSIDKLVIAINRTIKWFLRKKKTWLFTYFNYYENFIF